MIRVAAGRMMLASVLGTVGLSLFAGSACSSTSRTEVKDDDDDVGEAGAPGNVGGSDAGSAGGNAATGGAGGSGGAGSSAGGAGGSDGANSTTASVGGSAGADSGGSGGTDSGGSGGTSAGGASSSAGGAGGASTNTGGAGGTSTNTGGAGGTSTNAGGAGGTNTGGAGGTSTGTGGPDETAPTIVSVSPSDESSGVERDVVIEVEFSEAVSEASAAALELTGPDGRVPGSAEVDGAVVSFTPDAKLFLLGEYTVEVGTGVEDLAGNALEDDHSTSFKVRDGEWQPLEYPFGQTTARNGYQSAANHVGGLVIGGSDYNDPTRAWAGVFDPTTNDWSSATIVGSDATLDSSVRLAAINDDGQAAISWWRNSSASPGGWYRYTPDAGFENAGAQADTFMQLTAVNDTGIGMVVTQAGTHEAWFTLQDLESGVVGSVTDFSNSDDDLYGLFAVDSDFVLVHSRVQPDDTYDIVVSRYSTDTNDWAAPESVVSFPDQPGRSFAATDELGNLAVVYPEDGDLWARVYSSADDDWSLPTMIAEDETAAVVTMGGGNVMVYYWAADAMHLAYYAAGTGWIEAGRNTFVGYGGGAGAVDPRGNGLMFWSDSSYYSRYIPGSGWSEPQVLDLALNYYTYAAYAFLDGSVAVVTNESITGGQVPVVLRFE